MTHEQLWSALEAVVGSTGGLTRAEIGNKCAGVLEGPRHVDMAVRHLRSNGYVERRLSENRTPVLRNGDEVIVPTKYGYQQARRR